MRSAFGLQGTPGLAPRVKIQGGKKNARNGIPRVGPCPPMVGTNVPTEPQNSIVLGQK